jgi:hypothetical protein
MKAPKLLLLAIIVGLSGCAHPKITAYDLNKDKPVEVGLPYYLPKYYLVVSKNVRYIPMPTIGLTQTAPIPSSFDSGSSAADKASTGSAQDSKGGSGSGDKGTNTTGSASSGGKNKATAASAEGDSGTPALQTTQVVYAGNPGVIPATPTSDGLIPETFYTYQFVALPDLTQKYGLKVKGGAGELRATLNLVNGWMFTGPGPLYMRDSFTSQNVAAAGTSAQQITDSLARIASMAMGIPPLPTTAGGGGKGSNAPTAAETTKLPPKIDDFAVIGIWEIGVSDDKKKVTFSRVDLGGNSSMVRDIIALAPAPANPGKGNAGQQSDVDPKTDLPSALELALKDWELSKDNIHVTVTGNTIDVAVNFTDVTPPNGKTKNDFKTALENAVAQYVAQHTNFNIGKVTVN